MNYLNVNLSDPKCLVKSLQVEAPSAYNKNRSIRLGFNKESMWSGVFESMDGAKSPISLQGAEELADTLSQKFNVQVIVIKKLKSPSENPQGADSEKVWAATALKINDLTHYRSIIQFLSENDYISVSDRALLNPFITKVEQQLEFATKLTEEITHAQIDILTAVCEPYIDAIIDDCDNKGEKLEALLGQVATWGTFDPSRHKFSKRELALCTLIDAMQRGVSTLFTEYFEGFRENCSESGETLSAIYKGTSDLESTFIRSGTGVPYLTKQREAILNFIEAKLTEKFGPETCLEKDLHGNNLKLLQTLRSRLFCEGYHLDCVSLLTPEKKFCTMALKPFDAVIDALNHDFGTEYEKHFWFAENGETLKGESALQRFTQIQKEVESKLKEAE